MPPPDKKSPADGSQPIGAIGTVIIGGFGGGIPTPDGPSQQNNPTGNLPQPEIIMLSDFKSLTKDDGNYTWSSKDFYLGNDGKKKIYENMSLEGLYFDFQVQSRYLDALSYELIYDTVTDPSKALLDSQKNKVKVAVNDANDIKNLLVEMIKVTDDAKKSLNLSSYSDPLLKSIDPKQKIKLSPFSTKVWLQFLSNLSVYFNSAVFKEDIDPNHNFEEGIYYSTNKVSGLNILKSYKSCYSIDTKKNSTFVATDATSIKNLITDAVFTNGEHLFNTSKQFWKRKKQIFELLQIETILSNRKLTQAQVNDIFGIGFYDIDIFNFKAQSNLGHTPYLGVLSLNNSNADTTLIFENDYIGFKNVKNLSFVPGTEIFDTANSSGGTDIGGLKALRTSLEDASDKIKIIKDAFDNFDDSSLSTNFFTSDVMTKIVKKFGDVMSGDDDINLSFDYVWVPGTPGVSLEVFSIDLFRHCNVNVDYRSTLFTILYNMATQKRDIAITDLVDLIRRIFFSNNNISFGANFTSAEQIKARINGNDAAWTAQVNKDEGDDVKTGAVGGAAIGAVGGVVGAAVGAAVGAVVGEVVSFYSSVDTNTEYYNQLEMQQAILTYALSVLNNKIFNEAVTIFEEFIDSGPVSTYSGQYSEALYLCSIYNFILNIFNVDSAYAAKVITLLYNDGLSNIESLNLGVYDKVLGQINILYDRVNLMLEKINNYQGRIFGQPKGIIPAINTVMDELGLDKKSIYSPGQINLIISRVDDAAKRINGIDKVQLLDDSVIFARSTEVLSYNLNNFYNNNFGNLKFLNSINQGRHILSVGIPKGYLSTLKNKVIFDATKNNMQDVPQKQGDVIEIVIQKTEELYPHLRFEPISFLFDMSIFPLQSYHQTRNDGSVLFKDISSNNPNQFFDNLFNKTIYDKSYFHLTQDDKLKLGFSHTMSYILSLYLSIFSGIEVNEQSLFEDNFLTLTKSNSQNIFLKGVLNSEAVNLTRFTSQLDSFSKALTCFSDEKFVKQYLLSNRKFDRIFNLMIPQTFYIDEKSLTNDEKSSLQKLKNSGKVLPSPTGKSYISDKSPSIPEYQVFVKSI